MRWLVIHPGPDFSVADVHNGIVDALRAAGEEVLVYNLNDRVRFFSQALFDTGELDERGVSVMRRACTRDEALTLASEQITSMAYKWWPDVVLAISAFFTPPVILDMLRDRGHTVVLWHTESPYQEQEQLKRAPHADLNIINDPVSLELYRKTGPAEYIPHSYRPELHHPGKPLPELVSDFAFVGTGFPSRQAFFGKMDLEGLDVLLAGGWPGLPVTSPLHKYLVDPRMSEGDDVSEMICLDNSVTADIYRSSKASINLYRQEGEEDSVQGTAMGPREVEMAACGLWFARDSRPESDDVFPMLPSFSSPEEASELIRWHLAHGSVREKAATAAREAVADRTFDRSAHRLLNLVSPLRGMHG